VRQVPERSEDMPVSDGVNIIRRMRTKVAVDTYARYPTLSGHHINASVRIRPVSSVQVESASPDQKGRKRGI